MFGDFKRQFEALLRQYFNVYVGQYFLKNVLSFTLVVHMEGGGEGGGGGGVGVVEGLEIYHVFADCIVFTK